MKLDDLKMAVNKAELYLWLAAVWTIGMAILCSMFGAALSLVYKVFRFVAG